MLDICLNGDNEMLQNGSDLESQYEVQDTVCLLLLLVIVAQRKGNARHDRLYFRHVHEYFLFQELMALHTAAKLLQELQPVEDDILQTHILYPNFYLLATRQKSNVERALIELTTFATKHQQQDNPGVVFGLATAHLLLKQAQKARNQLKRLIKSTWTLEEGEYLERCWLLLSDIYIQVGQSKTDVANELLRRVLTYNRSSAKAFECLGYILEKEQAYREAAVHFESAWKMTNQNSPVVGYKLALSYLKAKQYTDAIDISQTVLAKYPDHPRIRKDVLDKALSSLRT